MGSNFLKEKITLAMFTASSLKHLKKKDFFDIWAEKLDTNPKDQQCCLSPKSFNTNTLTE